MRKTTIYLPDELKKRVEQTASANGMSEAELIRAAIDRYVRLEASPRPTLPLFSSGRGDLAERVDELLSEGFGRD